MTPDIYATRKAGVLLVVISAVVFSSAGVFTKSVSAEPWVIIFWRGLAASAFTLVYLALRGILRSEIVVFGWPALVVTLMGAAGSAAFIPAFKLSTVANVAMIYAAVPFVAAALSWIFIGERPGRVVLIASLAALLGVFAIVWGSLGSGQILGDLLALFMTLMLAGIMVVYRKYPDTTAALPAALSSVVLLPVAILMGTPSAVIPAELPVLIAFGLVFAVASVTLSEGARRLPSAETALLSILEMPLAPILAFLILAEAPTVEVMMGGCIVFCSVLWSQIHQARL
ncbi:MAG: DMT family transporter [Pseudomonadota bacterium]